MHRKIMTFAIGLAAVVPFLFADEEARGQTTVNVDVGDVYFCDSSFTGGICETNITAGDTVTWDWVGNLAHTVTQCNDSFTTCPLAGGFDSGSQSNGAAFSQTFNTAGSFAYLCIIHGAGMSGRINVAAAQATPTASAGPTASPAQTGTAGPTAPAAPAATQTAAVPAAVPGTGGGEGDSGPSWQLVLAIAGGVLLIASAGVGVVVLRRR